MAYHFPKRSRKLLEPRLGLLSLCDELNDARQRRIAARAGDLDSQCPVEVAGPCLDFISFFFGNRMALAGQME